jgi:hypothetical protein
MSKPFKVDEVLKDQPDERAEFEAFARDPGRTIDELHEWLLSRGYTLARSSVHTWKTWFDSQVLAERFSRNSELASAIKGAVEAGKFESVADAAVMQLTNVVFEQAAKLEAEGEIDPLDVQRMTRSLSNLIGGKQRLVAMLAEKFDKATAKLTAEKRQITTEDLDEVRKAMFG